MRSDNRPNPVARIFAPFIMILIGIVLIFVSSLLTKQDAGARDRCTEQVQASVVSFARPEAEPGETKQSNAVTPVFEYTYNGETYTSQSGTYSSTFKDIFQTGQVYTVFVDPADPYEIYSEEIARSNATTYKVLRFVGIGVIILGFFLFIGLIIKIVVLGSAAGFAASTLLSKKQK